MDPTTVLSPSSVEETDDDIPPLENGDRLDQKTFHARYKAMPEKVKAELVEGIVYMASPLKAKHGRPHARLIWWLIEYMNSTPSTDVVDNTTFILGDESEPQPDAGLILLPEHGGLCKEDAEGYLAGPPELACEVASSSESFDLHAKKRDYERAGVREYLVLIERQKRAVWFARPDNQADGEFIQIPPDADGILRSRVFGGLWLDAPALFRKDMKRIREVLELGLASPDHSRMLVKLQ